MPVLHKVTSFTEAPAKKVKKLTRDEFIKGLPDMPIYIWTCDKCHKEVLTQCRVEYIACGTCHKVMKPDTKDAIYKENK